MITIRNLTLDNGIPKLCIPIVGESLSEIVQECRYIQDKPHDLLELRIDFFKNLSDFPSVSSVLQAIAQEKGGAPLLFTCRTKGEGGEADLPDGDYFALNNYAVQTGYVDAVDIEYNRSPSSAEETLRLAKARGVAVVMSSHEFHTTPSYDEIVERLIAMKKRGADIVKFACMPHAPKDVLTLLAATEAVKSMYPDEPLITMSMGKLGAISRVCGETFGSAITFGSARKASAPGQLDAATLQSILTSLSRQ